ncbi:MAG TPA: DUF4339 domain-containing protein [Luteolibacter sp.]|nr:DUF4339 domain-containing protein [Luteolibacter sp.]
MSQWYYAKEGRQNGPVGIEELKSLARSGTLSRTDLVWNQSMKDWLPAGGIEGIFDAAAIPSGTPPPVAGNPYATPDSAWIQAPGVQVALGEEIEPGSDPIGVGKCIQRGFDLTVKQVLTLMLTALIAFAVLFAVSLPFSMAQGFSQMRGNTPMPPPEIMKDPVAAFQWGMQTQFTLMYFLQQAVSLVASSFLVGGAYRICLNVASGLPASPGQLFGESGKMLRILAIYVLMNIPSWLGFFALAYLPITAGGVVMAILWLVMMVLWIRVGFSMLAVVDRNLGVGESLKYSISITRNNTWRLIGLGILSFLIAALGLMACIIPGLFTVPVAFMAFTVAYRWLQYGRRVAG